MDCFEQINKLFSNEDHNTIIKSQIYTFTNCRNSTETKEETKLFLPTSIKHCGSKTRIAPEIKNTSNENSNFIKEGTKANRLRGNQKKNMSDWGETDSLNDADGGRGFGADNEVYKVNDNEYQKEDNCDDYNAEETDNDYGNRKRYNGGGGSGGGGRGRSGGRGGGDRNGTKRYQRDNNGYNENGESNAHAEMHPQSKFKNFVFALTPKDFKEDTLKLFLEYMKDLFNKATLVQKYTLMRYLMDAYEKVLKETDKFENKNEQSKKSSRSKKSQQIQTSIAAERTIQQPEYDNSEEIFSELPSTLRAASMSSTSSSAMDFLNVYQQDVIKLQNESNFSLIENNAFDENSQTHLDDVLPIHQLPSMNISDLFDNTGENNTDSDLLASFSKRYPPNQQLQEKSLDPDEITEQINRCRNERVEASGSDSNRNRLRYSFRTPKSKYVPMAYVAETPPMTPEHNKTRYHLTEEEYSLRFRLPRRKFLKICQLPFVKYNIETSAFSYFPMNMSLIEREYLCKRPLDVGTNENNLVQPPAAPNTNSFATSTATSDQYSSLNVVRQAPSGMKDFSSFGRPLLQPSAISELSRLESERLNRSVHQDICYDSIPALGEIYQQSQPTAEVHTSEIPLEPISMEPINLPQISSTFTPDSGIQYPTPAVCSSVTAKSGLMQPSSSSATNSAAGGEAQTRMPQPQTVPSDSGVFKTPMIPQQKLQSTKATTDLASVEVHDFESNLKNRTLDTSTPLSVSATDAAILPFLKPRKTRLIERETSNVANISESILTQNKQQTENAVQSALQMELQPIVEVGEDIIRPSVFNESNMPTPVGHTIPSSLEQNPTNTHDEDYRRDWYEILRARLQNCQYEKCVTPKRRRRYKRPQGKLPSRMQILQTNQNETNKEQEEATSDLLQQALAGILPPVPSSREVLNGNTPPNQTLNISTESCLNAADIFSVPIVTAEQQQYDQFILNNSENIVKIVDNLESCRLMLSNYRRGIEKKLNSNGDLKQQPCQHFNPEVLLKASKKRLEIKLNLIQNIIRQVSFDFTKCEFIKDRMSAAIGFAFLLELKAAGIINLSNDGHIVALRNGGEHRNGYGGGRGRGGGGGGRGGFRDVGRREFDKQNGDGGEGGDGEEQKKPREFYIPPQPTDNEDEIFGSGITSGINFSKYDSIPVKVTGENAPGSIQSFEEAAFRDIVMNNIKKSGYKVPTPIQKTAIPVILNGRDLMGCAQTGSGKTAAFLLPIINSLLSEGAETSIGKPQALIVSPTRELAIQISNEARKFSLGSYLNIQLIYGGTSSKHQGENIGRGGSHILICTPGRLLDFVAKGYISFEECRFVVLDEADRMLDLGFKDSIATIMNHPTMRPMEERQNLMFSATFPAEIQRMAGEYLNEYIFISVGVVGGACSDVTQNIYEVKKFQKRGKLMEILQENPDGTIVFVETKRGADFLASLLSETEFPTTSIHGDRLQSQREMALADFKSGKMKVLIATSVAARGLDIKNIKHVINYDMPSSIDEYVHRIGRTGRVGNNGRASSFFDPESDSAIAGDLVNILEGAGQEIPDFLKNYSSGGGGGRGGFNRQFGGRDVRKDVAQTDDNFVTYEGPTALEEDEEWN